MREKESDLKEAFINELSEELFNKPFIVIEDIPDPELHTVVYNLCKANGIRYEYITTEDQAIKMRMEY